MDVEEGEITDVDSENELLSTGPIESPPSQQISSENKFLKSPPEHSDDKHNKSSQGPDFQNLNVESENDDLGASGSTAFFLQNFQKNSQSTENYTNNQFNTRDDMPTGRRKKKASRWSADDTTTKQTTTRDESKNMVTEQLGNECMAVYDKDQLQLTDASEKVSLKRKLEQTSFAIQDNSESAYGGPQPKSKWRSGGGRYRDLDNVQDEAVDNATKAWFGTTGAPTENEIDHDENGHHKTEPDGNTRVMRSRSSKVSETPRNSYKQSAGNRVRRFKDEKSKGEDDFETQLRLAEQQAFGKALTNADASHKTRKSADETGEFIEDDGDEEVAGKVVDDVDDDDYKTNDDYLEETTLSESTNNSFGYDTPYKNPFPQAPYSKIRKQQYSGEKSEDTIDSSYKPKTYSQSSRGSQSSIRGGRGSSGHFENNQNRNHRAASHGNNTDRYKETAVYEKDNSSSNFGNKRGRRDGYNKFDGQNSRGRGFRGRGRGAPRGRGRGARGGDRHAGKFSKFGKKSEYGETDVVDPDNVGNNKFGEQPTGRHENKFKGKNRYDSKVGKNVAASYEINFKANACRFYQEGRCHKGDDCKFSHDTTVIKKKELCKYYLQDTCTKGDNCIFMHSDYPCKFFHTGVECYSAENCKFSHKPLTEDTKQLLVSILDNPSTAANIVAKKLGESEIHLDPETNKFTDMQITPTKIQTRTKSNFYSEQSVYDSSSNPNTPFKSTPTKKSTPPITPNYNNREKAENYFKFSPTSDKQHGRTTKAPTLTETVKRGSSYDENSLFGSHDNTPNKAAASENVQKDDETAEDESEDDSDNRKIMCGLGSFLGSLKSETPALPAQHNQIKDVPKKNLPNDYVRKSTAAHFTDRFKVTEKEFPDAEQEDENEDGIADNLSIGVGSFLGVFKTSESTGNSNNRGVSETKIKVQSTNLTKTSYEKTKEDGQEIDEDEEDDDDDDDDKLENKMSLGLGAFLNSGAITENQGHKNNKSADQQPEEADGHEDENEEDDDDEMSRKMSLGVGSFLGSLSEINTQVDNRLSSNFFDRKTSFDSSRPSNSNYYRKDGLKTSTPYQDHHGDKGFDKRQQWQEKGNFKKPWNRDNNSTTTTGGGYGRGRGRGGGNFNNKSRDWNKNDSARGASRCGSRGGGRGGRGSDKWHTNKAGDYNNQSNKWHNKDTPSGYGGQNNRYNSYNNSNRQDGYMGNEQIAMESGSSSNAHPPTGPSNYHQRLGVNVLTNRHQNSNAFPRPNSQNSMIGGYRQPLTYQQQQHQLTGAIQYPHQPGNVPAYMNQNMMPPIMPGSSAMFNPAATNFMGAPPLPPQMNPSMNRFMLPPNFPPSSYPPQPAIQPYEASPGLHIQTNDGMLPHGVSPIVPLELSTSSSSNTHVTPSNNQNIHNNHFNNLPPPPHQVMTGKGHSSNDHLPTLTTQTKALPEGWVLQSLSGLPRRQRFTRPENEILEVDGKLIDPRTRHPNYIDVVNAKSFGPKQQQPQNQLQPLGMPHQEGRFSEVSADPRRHQLLQQHNNATPASLDPRLARQTLNNPHSSSNSTSSTEPQEGMQSLQNHNKNAHSKQPTRSNTMPGHTLFRRGSKHSLSGAELNNKSGIEGELLSDESLIISTTKMVRFTDIQPFAQLIGGSSDDKNNTKPEPIKSQLIPGIVGLSAAPLKSNVKMPSSNFMTGPNQTAVNGLVTDTSGTPPSLSNFKIPRKARLGGGPSTANHPSIKDLYETVVETESATSNAKTKLNLSDYRARLGSNNSTHSKTNQRGDDGSKSFRSKNLSTESQQSNIYPFTSYTDEDEDDRENSFKLKIAVDIDPDLTRDLKIGDTGTRDGDAGGGNTTPVPDEEEDNDYNDDIAAAIENNLDVAAAAASKGKRFNQQNIFNMYHET